MKRWMLVLFAFAVLTLIVPVMASAQTTTVTYQGMNTTGTVHIYRDGSYFGHYYAGEMRMLIEGAQEAGYCVDLDNSINQGQTYEAYLVPLEAEYPWCEIMYILSNYDATDNFWGSVIQVALWKLVYGPDNVYVSESNVEAAADALLLEAAGKCWLNCESDVSFEVDSFANADGTIAVQVTVTADGNSVAGQEVTLTSSGGMFLDPAGGTGVTGENGVLLATLALGTDPLPVTVYAEAFGQSFYKVVPAYSLQQTLTFTYGDECEFSGESTFEGQDAGNPRTIGFWKHQAKVAIGSKGKAHISTGTLESWLPLESFGLVVADLQGLYDALWLKNAEMEERAQQQCLATKLNIEYGELGYFVMVDTNYDGEPDKYLYQAFAEAESAFNGGDPETAKSICDSINNM